MRYINMFLLHFQDAFYERARSFVWFLIPSLNALLILIFWIGVFHEKGVAFSNWSLPSISSYYFLLIIAGSFLEMHIEEDVARLDIQEGGLSMYLLRPFSYFWFKFFHEIPWRIIQGTYGLLLFAVFGLFFGRFVQFADSFLVLGLSFIIIVLAFFMSFVFKMIIGISAFWITDFTGLQQIVELIFLIFAGYIIPLEFLPQFFANVAYNLPFSYMIYFPIVALEGKLSVFALLRVIETQLLWMVILSLIYKYLWKKGIREFTAIGQ